MASIFTTEQSAVYERDGYVTVRGLFDGEEIALMREAIETDPALRSSLYDRKDGRARPRAWPSGIIPATASTGWPRARIAWSTGWSRCWAARSTTTTPS